MRWPSEATTWPASTIGCMVRPLSVPQSTRVDDAVLRHVDQTTGQVTRVRRLQGGVGQTLAGAVGRVEVLEHGQAFLEVRDDRRLDDFDPTAWPSGRACRRAASSASANHAHRSGASCRSSSSASDGRFPVELDRLDALHHFVGDLVRALGPGVDDLVVLLALGDQAVIVLLLVLLGQSLRCRRPA